MEIAAAEKELKELSDGYSWIWPESDYGRAEVWRKNDRYFVFEIPQYGGIPQYHSSYGMSYVSDMVALIASWS